MKTYKDFLGKCYIELDRQYCFIYKIIEQDSKPGLECYETQIKPNSAFVYNDICEDNDLTYINKFIPELNKECNAIELPHNEFLVLSSRIKFLEEIQNEVEQRISKFTKEVWTGIENMRK